MPTYYVYSEAVGDADGSDWTNAFTNRKAAIEAGAAGDMFKVAHDHNYSYGDVATTITSPGTFAAPCIEICENRTTGAYANTAVESANVGYGLTMAGYLLSFGVNLASGRAFTLSDNANFFSHDAEIDLNRTSTEHIILGEGACLELEDVSIDFQLVTDYISIGSGAKFSWRGGSLLTDQNLLIDFGMRGGYAEIRGVDLSIMAGGSFFNGCGTAGDDPGFVGLITGCKFNATVPTINGETPVQHGVHLQMQGNSGNVPYFVDQTAEGITYHDSGVYRAGADPSSNNFSAEMVSNANASFYRPMRYKLAERWCSANPTIKVHCTHDVNGDTTDLQTDEFWIEIEYPTSGNAAYRQWNKTSKMAILGSPADLTTEGAAGWTNSAGVDNSVSVTISGGAAGVHTVWVCLARISETVYVCPQIDVS